MKPRLALFFSVLIFLIFLGEIGCNGSGNQTPVAQAGPDQVVSVGETVQLDGSASHDPEGDPFTALWEIVQAPAGSQAAHSNPQSFQTSFVADVPGTYLVRLFVQDGSSSEKLQPTDGVSGGPIDHVQVNAVLPLPFSGIALDYDPEVRCADSNWAPFTIPVACSPQLSFTCPAPPPTDPFQNLTGCPDRCQSCFDQDLSFLKTNLAINTLTVYQPNYYIMTAAKKLGMKVMMGLFNDQVLSLATPASKKASCTYAGFPALCGLDAVKSLINGACGATTPWPTANFCQNGTYIPAFKSFLDDGTVVAIQLGNEILTSPINSQGTVLTPAQVLSAAKTLRDGLNLAGYTHLPIVVSFVAGTEQDLCTNGAPPANVDGIASHPYCNNVASVPPTWPWETGSTPAEEAQAAQSCANQVLQIFNSTAVANCGQAQSFIGETGYNTGCPGQPDESTHLAVAANFYPDMVTLACQNNIPLFFFDYADACPPGGCTPGCASSSENVGNGYFGIYYTDGYLTKGNLTPKFNPLPTLSCP